MDRSACGVSVSVSLPLAGVPPGGVAVAVLVRVPVDAGSGGAGKVKVTLAPAGRSTGAVFTRLTTGLAAELICATAVKVTVPPGSRVTVVLMLLLPLLAATLEPVEADAVQLTDVMADGKLSVTAWFTAVLGPAFL